MLEVLHGRLRKWFSCGCRRLPFPFRRRPPRWVGRGPAHDVGLDHEVVSTTNHHKMFDIVTADDLKPQCTPESGHSQATLGCPSLIDALSTFFNSETVNWF
jgi:hypothetical protein